MTPSLRVMQMQEKEKEGEVFAVERREDLEGLDEKREKDQERSRRYRQKMTEAYGRMTKERVFVEGQFVLKVVDYVRQGLVRPSKFVPKWEADLLRKTQGKMRSHGLGRKDLQRKKMKGKIKGKGNLLRPVGMGAAGTIETSTVGIVEISAVGTVEKGAEGAAGMGTTGMAGAGIPTPAGTPGPSNVSASREIGIQMKHKYI